MASGAAVPPQRLALALLVLCCLHLAPAQTLPRPLARDAIPARATPLEAEGAGEDPPSSSGGGGGSVSRRACAYTVQIKTSCASPRASPDAVSLAFGDAYRDEAYAARVTPERGFERCATDTFRVSGPCGYGVCYLYLRRAGRVGWTPQWVRVYEPTSDTPSTFYYGDPLPNGVWYGFNRCPHRAGGGEGSADGAQAQVL